jgi:DNA-binding NarL/FixJ family response regulator
MGTRVLIVDDHEGFIASATALLEGEGLEVVGSASTTAQALVEAERLLPDVVLLDLGLGAESGIEAARELARSDRASGWTVILTSTRDHSDVADLVDGSPVAGFITKPELSAATIRRLGPVDGPSDGPGGTRSTSP